MTNQGAQLEFELLESYYHEENQGAEAHYSHHRHSQR
jgi:hypothetical protein